MKKLLKLTLLIITLIGFNFVASAQKTIKEGTAIYTVEYDLPADQQSIAGMLPTEFKVSFKGEYSTFTMDMGIFTTTVISNNTTNEKLSLTEVPMQNKKIAVKMSPEQFKKMQGLAVNEEDLKVTQTSETKKIAGYNCTKYLMKDKESNTDAEIWATTEINMPTNSLNATIKGIKGVPIAFNTNASGIKSKLTLKSVVEEPVADISFVAPTDYELMDFNDLMSQMGK